MSQLEQTVARYRSLRLSAAADELTNLLAEAEANEMSYLSFADRLAEHELIQLRIPANVTGHSGDRDRFAHGHHAGVSFVL